jgi:hypothetical protein
LSLTYIFIYAQESHQAGDIETVNEHGVSNNAAATMNDAASASLLNTGNDGDTAAIDAATQMLLDDAARIEAATQILLQNGATIGEVPSNNAAVDPPTTNDGTANNSSDTTEESGPPVAPSTSGPMSHPVRDDQDTLQSNQATAQLEQPMQDAPGKFFHMLIRSYVYIHI